MFCNCYTNGIDEQPGDQPTRVFYSLIKKEFEQLRTLIDHIDSSKGIKNIKLQYLTENIRAIGPHTNGKLIVLHDTFLTFFWAYSYGSLVLAPLGGKVVSKEENKIARDLIKYSFTLLEKYTPYEKTDYPNPELFQEDVKGFISASNAIYLFGIRFIILHEFAHTFLGHTKTPRSKISKKIYHQFEFEADELVIDWSLQLFNSETKFSGRLALVTALNSLSVTSNHFYKTQRHPAPEDRITRCLEKLNPNKNEYIWGYSIWHIMEWQTNFKLFHIPLYQKGDGYKKYYYELVEELKQFKSTGKSRYDQRKGK